MRVFSWPSRLVVIGVLALSLMGFSYAFAAATVVPGTTVGEGAGTISGYTITNVVFTLNGTNPSNIDQVDFDAAPDPTGSTTMKIKLVAAGTDWYTCTNVLAAMTCVTTAPQATVQPSDELRVVIAD